MTSSIDRIAVTGANGFVGSSVVRNLREAGALPIPIVRTAQGQPNEIIAGEINQLHARDLPRIDAMVHLVARTHVTHETATDALSAYRHVNVEGTRSALVAARKANAKHFIFLSSIKALGEETRLNYPFRDDSLAAPEDPYGITKLEAESIVREMADQWGLAWTIIRPPLVYGPGVVANFRTLIKLVERGVPLPVGAVRNRRSLIYVENLANFVLFCLQEKAARGKILAVSDGKALSTAEIVQKIADAGGKRARLLRIPPKTMRYIATLMGCSSVYRRLFASLEIDPRGAFDLGWSPPFDQDEAFRCTV